MRDETSAPRQHRGRNRTWGAVAALTALIGLVVALWAGPASADSSSADSSSADSSSASPSSSATSYNPARAKRVCARVPTVTAKVDNALTRVRAGADTKGSIAWLNAQAAKAESDGKTALANAYRAKAKIRTDRVAVLLDRKSALVQAAAWCKSAGY